MPGVHPAPHIYDLIIIGRGTSAAVYLNTLRTYHEFTLEPEIPPLDILVIGKDDPWAGARGHEDGHYIKNINQAAQLFEHGRQARGSKSQEPVDRVAWANQNHGIIEEVSQGNVLDAEVTTVRKDVSGQEGYFVETAGKGTYRSRKVVIATGAGIETSDRQYHHVPDEVVRFRQTGYTQNKRILDLDQFQKGQEGSRMGARRAVAIIGPNAGTDAIMEAATRGYARENVYWLMSKTSTPGVALTWDVSSAGIEPTFTAEESGRNRADGGCVVRYESLKISVGGARALKITTDKDVFEVDYLIYAVGQRGGGINRAEVGENGRVTQVPFVHRTLASQLEPIYDVNQRFSDMEAVGSGGAWQHVVGLQLEGSSKSQGIEIVGSAATQASRKVAHNYLDREYNALLKHLNPAFISGAKRNRFSELYQMTSFAKIWEDGHLATRSDQYYERKKSNYLLAMEIQVRLSTGALLGSASDPGKRDKIISSSLAQVNDLCYMFMLRIKAARFLHDKRVTDMLSSGLKRSLPDTVNDGRLLGGIQRNVAATNQHHNVQHIRTNHGVNFLEDQQTLALYVAVHYPNIEAGEANAIVGEIVQARKDKMRGFDRDEIAAWERRLMQANRVPRRQRGWVTHFRP